MSRTTTGPRTSPGSWYVGGQQSGDTEGDTRESPEKRRNSAVETRIPTACLPPGNGATDPWPHPFFPLPSAPLSCSQRRDEDRSRGDDGDETETEGDTPPQASTSEEDEEEEEFAALEEDWHRPVDEVLGLGLDLFGQGHRERSFSSQRKGLGKIALQLPRQVWDQWIDYRTHLDEIALAHPSLQVRARLTLV